MRCCSSQFVASAALSGGTPCVWLGYPRASSMPGRQVCPVADVLVCGERARPLISSPSWKSRLSRLPQMPRLALMTCGHHCPQLLSRSSLIQVCHRSPHIRSSIDRRMHSARCSYSLEPSQWLQALQIIAGCSSCQDCTTLQCFTTAICHTFCYENCIELAGRTSVSWEVIGLLA